VSATVPLPPGRPLPSEEEMFRAFVARDRSYDGIFFTGVKTTGIFCRPSCPARKPKRRNVVFCATAAEALELGLRPCLRCRPLDPPEGTPATIRTLLRELEGDSSLRLRDADLRDRGLEPATVRRWFKANHGMTFHAFQRSRRLGRALEELGRGGAVTQAAFGNGWDSLSGFDQALRKLTGRSPGTNRDTPVLHLSRVETPLGPMLMGALEEGVCLLEFTDRPLLETQLRRIAKLFGSVPVPGENRHTRLLREELAAYFAGEVRSFATPLVITGTPFQERAWGALLRIPYGETRSYGEQARMVEAPRAVRAVARANGDNRIAVVIPCHRVVGGDGALTGYGGGLWRKRWLLHHEGVELPSMGGAGRGAAGARGGVQAQTELELPGRDG